MEKLPKFNNYIRDQYPNIDEDIIEILKSPDAMPEGLCISEIKQKYKELTGDRFPIENGPIAINQFLLSIPMVAATCNENGTLLYFYVTEDMIV